jgi:serpin B
MMSSLRTAAALALALLAFIPSQITAAQPNSNAKTVANSTDQFALDFYAKLRGSTDANIFCSPYSVYSALAMTSAGARGDTASQMASVLHVAKDENLHSAVAALTKQFNDAGKQGSFQLSVANRIWGQSGFKFLDAFLTILRDQYDADLQQLDFARGEAARKTINDWIEKATSGKIKDLIPAGALDASTRLVLTNAVYFKGTWQDQFKKDATQPAPFHQSASKSFDVPMMYQKEHYELASTKLGDDKGLKLLKVPYKAEQRGRGLSMVVILPDDTEGLAAVEKGLTSENLNKWMAAFRGAEVKIWLPKFKLTSEFQLRDPLAALGMPLAFDGSKADFSGMDGRRDLFLSEVFHKAFVDVNEEGTEAAAATAGVVRVMAMPNQPEPQVFRADHPFLFLIRDETSGCILFIGRVTDPRG